MNNLKRSENLAGRMLRLFQTIAISASLLTACQQAKRESCMANLEKLDPRLTALRNYDLGDKRVLVYPENNEGAYPEAPGVEKFIGTSSFSGRPEDAHELAISRDKSHQLNCVDCDYPLDSCGEKKSRWMALYNMTICRRALKDHVARCGIGRL